MADVTEIIHKITYEVNNDALNNATKSIQAQIKELNALGKTIERYAKQLENMSSSEMKQLDDLAKKIDEVNKKVVTTVSKTKGALDEVFRGIAKGFDIPDSLKGSVTNYIKEIRKEFQNLSKASGDTSKGISGGLKTSIGNLGKSLFSINGLLGIGVNLLIDFASEAYNSSRKTDKLTEQLNDLDDALKSIEDDVYTNASNNIARIQYLSSVVDDTSRTMNERLGALKKLQDEFPAYFNNLDEEAIKHGKVADAVNEATDAILAQASAQAAYEQFKKVSTDEFNAGRNVTRIQADIDDYTKKANPDDLAKYYKYKQEKKDGAEGNVDLIAYGIRIRQQGVNPEELVKKLDALEEAKKLRAALKKEKEELLQEAKDLANAAKIVLQKNKNNSGTDDNTTTTTTTTTTSRPKPKPQPKPKDLNIKLEPTFDPDEAERTSEEITRREAQKNAIKLRSQIPDRIQRVDDKEQKELLANERAYQAGLRSLEAYEEEKTKITQKYVLERLDAEIAANQEILNLQGLSVEQKEIAERELTKATVKRTEITNKQKTADKQAADNANNDEKQKGLTDAQKENIKKGINAYQQLAQAAADAYNTIIQAQIDALDKEISVREKRVEAAKKLAERGNTEVLKLEEDRLRKAEAKRAQFAKRQQAINAAITVSNAIAAVARAALEGGGFGSVATIAALIAALATGYAAVTSMSQDGGGDAFADGVVGYQGKGGPRDDKNWVRISAGESVITAEGTQRNRALLEAINNGAAFSTINPALMPMLKQPKGLHQEHYYATTKDLNGLEKKLDDVVYAIEGNKLKQNIFFDEQGVGIMTERAINKNRKRWK